MKCNWVLRCSTYHSQSAVALQTGSLFNSQLFSEEVNMISEVADIYFRRAMHLGYLTYQCPIVWDKILKRFRLDGSKKYWMRSRMILVGELFSLTCLIVLAYSNYNAGLSNTFTLMLVGALGPVTQNIILDVFFLMHDLEVLHTMNTCCEFGMSIRGNYKLRNSRAEYNSWLKVHVY